MDPLELLAASLIKDQSSNLAQDPFYSAGTGIDEILSTMPHYKLKPWQALLAGALGGFGSGVLKGIGTASADRKNAVITDKLAQALSTTGDEQQALFADTPELSKYGSLLKLQDLVDKREQEQMKTKALAEMLMKPPTMRTINQGSTEIQQQYDPIGRTWEQVGSGPRWDPGRDNSGLNAAIPEEVAQQLATAAAKAQGLEMPSPELIKTYSNARTAGLMNALTGDIGVQGRSDRTAGYKEKQSALFGYEPIDDKVMLTPGEKKDWDEKISATNSIVDKFDILAKSGDLNAITGQDSATQAAISAELFNKFRVLTNSGARLEEKEAQMLRAMMPRVAAGDLSGAIKAGLLGRDQKVFANDLKDLLTRSLDVELLSVGFKNKNKPLSAYPEETVKRLGLSPQNGASTDITSAPPNLSFDEFKAWKRSQGK